MHSEDGLVTLKRNNRRFLHSFQRSFVASKPSLNVRLCCRLHDLKGKDPPLEATLPLLTHFCRPGSCISKVTRLEVLRKRYYVMTSVQRDCSTWVKPHDGDYISCLRALSEAQGLVYRIPCLFLALSKCNGCLMLGAVHGDSEHWIVRST